MSDAASPSLHLRLEGFEGPLDLLLDLARAQKVDLAKLDADSSFGLTIVCETPFRGGGTGRVVALGGDGKERWKVDGMNWP
ncbi:MAG: hypothetical protein ACOYOH_28485, partial [Paracraurococcus sp.]